MRCKKLDLFSDIEDLKVHHSYKIRQYISYDRANRPEREALLKQVSNDLIRVGVLKPDDPIVFRDLLFQKYGYVVYDHIRKEVVQEIHDYLHAFDIHPCGRYGAWEYLWTDETILNGKAAAEKVATELNHGGSLDFREQVSV